MLFLDWGRVWVLRITVCCHSAAVLARNEGSSLSVSLFQAELLLMLLYSAWTMNSVSPSGVQYIVAAALMRTSPQRSPDTTTATAQRLTASEKALENPMKWIAWKPSSCPRGTTSNMVGFHAFVTVCMLMLTQTVSSFFPRLFLKSNVDMFKNDHSKYHWRSSLNFPRLDR